MTPVLRDSRGWDFVDWCRLFVVHGEGDLWGQPFILRPDQELWALRWFEVDATGNWWHERCYYEAPKGDGKTMLLAAAALFELFGPLAPPHPNVPVAAAGQDQAMKDGIFGRICQILSHDACPLKPFARVGYDVIERLDRPGQIRCIPANGNTTDGGLPTLFLADEVQDWFHTAADAHERNENSTTKREAPVGRSISASTPGEYAGDGSVGWRLHNYGEQIVKGTVPDDRFLFVQHKADDKWDLDDPVQLESALRQANHGASDRKIERLTRRFREIPRHRFCRFHLGQWVVSDGVRWMDMDAWQRQRVPELPAPGSEIVAFFDGSVNDDATGIVGQTAAGHLFVVGCWEKPEFGPEWKVPKDEVNLVVADMMATWKVTHFGYDPSAGWRSDGQDWERLYGDGVVHETPPTDARAAPACDQLYSDIVNGTVTHDGDLRLFDHVRNAVGKRTAKGTTIRKESQDSPRKIDLAFCAVMANDLRVRFMLQPKKRRTLVTF